MSEPTFDNAAKAALGFFDENEPYAVRLENEIKQLRATVVQIEAERDEWRRIAGQLANEKKQRRRAKERKAVLGSE